MRNPAVLILFSVFLLFWEPLESSATDSQEKVVLNFRDTDVRIVAQAMGDYTGKTVLIDPRAKGRLTIISAGEVSRELVFDIFLSSLRLNGLAVVEDGDVIKIVPEPDAKTSAGEVFGDKMDAGGDRIVTQVYQIQKDRASDLLPVLKPLISANNIITAYDGSNTLVITDYASNINRLNRIIASLDHGQDDEVEILPLKNISATEFVSLYEKIYMSRSSVSEGAAAQQGAKAAVGQGIRFALIADTRTNSLIVRSGHPAALERIRRLIERVDIPASARSGIHYVKLNFADAKSVAATLNGALGGSPAGGAQGGAGGKSSDEFGKVLIQADETTKSLLISAPASIFEELMSMIEKLDSRRKQIYVEALIAEISSDKAAELGVQWQSIRGFDVNIGQAVTAVGSSNVGPAGNSISELSTPGGLGAGLNIGLISGTLTLADGTVIPNILSLAHALETVSNANILSTPTLLALDNEQAKIVVGQNVPLLTGSYAASSGSQNNVNPFQTYERKDIGLTLRIKPQISEQGTIRLDIYQEVSSLLPVTVNTGASDVVTNKRSLESTVLVEDGQIIVLGGLIQDNVTDSANKVPLLGDIPVIGQLFRYETRRRVKTNLMVFLRPFILRQSADSKSATLRNYEYIIGEQGDIKVSGSLILPDMASPTLPSIGEKEPNPKSSNQAETAR